MRRPLALLAVVLLLGAAAGAFLVSNSKVGSRFVFESIPANRRPVTILVDTEAVPGVTDPRGVTQDLMNRWNAIAEAENPFGAAGAGGPYNGSTVGMTFGTFADTQHEVAFDDTGAILAHFGVDTGILGITLKSVDASSGRLLDFLVVVNTQPGALFDPGGATAEELFRGTLLHELGHAIGLGHTPVGMANTGTFGIELATPAQLPTMFPFRFSSGPEEGGTLEADDRAGAVQSYPDVAAATLGSISGRVRSVSGAPANEIAVRAIGSAGDHVGRITNADGSNQGTYTIANLPAGAYRVVVETINGRGGVDEGAIGTNDPSLGGDPFLYASDERWQVGDTYDPAADDPADFTEVQVRAGRDTGSVDFVLDARPILLGQTLSGDLDLSDARLPVQNTLRLADYFVFQGSTGQTVSLTAASLDFTPQLRLLRPSDLAVEDEQLPPLTNSTTLSHTLTQTGIHTVAVFARAAAGSPLGRGAYTLRLLGAGAALPAPPTPTGASVTVGPAQPGAQQSASPTCLTPMLQIRCVAPSHAELWIDRLRVRASGTAQDVVDVASVTLLQDLDGDGRRDGNEPVVATGAFGSDNGTLTFDDLALEFDAGTTSHLLVLVEMRVQSVSSAGFPSWIFLLPAAFLLLLRPRRAATALLLLALLVPLSCGGGGGGGPNCGGPFDPAGAIVDLRLEVPAGEILAYTSVSTAALNLPTAPLTSSVFAVSN